MSKKEQIITGFVIVKKNILSLDILFVIGDVPSKMCEKMH